MSPSPCVLVIDDDDTIRDLVVAVLGDEGYQVVAVDDAQDALAAARTVQPVLILLDSMVHGQSHALFVEGYRRLSGPHAPIYLFTAALGAEEAARQFQLSGVLAKPFDIEALIALAERHAGRSSP